MLITQAKAMSCSNQVSATISSIDAPQKGTSLINRDQAFCEALDDYRSVARYEAAC